MSHNRDGIIEIYERVMRIVWQRLSPTFGIRTINAIAKNVIVRQARDHPFTHYLSVDSEGLVWSELRAHSAEISQEEMSAGLDILLDDFFDALSNLIGRLVVGKLFQEAEEMVKKGEVE
ncbi:MAG TPA: hypothetical protein VHS28_00560 [Chloroflexota bacterium]|nr:hypothetical protein [Chloroflexota bacterium]